MFLVGQLTYREGRVNRRPGRMPGKVRFEYEEENRLAQTKDWRTEQLERESYGL